MLKECGDVVISEVLEIFLYENVNTLMRTERTLQLTAV